MLWVGAGVAGAGAGPAGAEAGGAAGVVGVVGVGGAVTTGAELCLCVRWRVAGLGFVSSARVGASRTPADIGSLVSPTLGLAS